MSKGSRKGSAFEREVCTKLSLWWSDGKRDDIFWRTSGSGARATTRGKKKKNTFGQYGDIQAIDPLGQAFVDCCTVEIKRGYSSNTFADLMDRSETHKEQVFEQFIRQANESHCDAGSYSWLLIVKRNMREVLIFMPSHLYLELKSIDRDIREVLPSTYFRFNFEKGTHPLKVFVTTFQQFLSYVKPGYIKRILEYTQNKETEENDQHKKDQKYKCPNCDEETVQWNGRCWQCTECNHESVTP